MFSSPMPLDLFSRTRPAGTGRSELKPSRGVRTFRDFPTAIDQNEPHRLPRLHLTRWRDGDSPRSLVNIAPSESVERRTIACGENMYADVVQSIAHGRVEFRFRAPVHLLVMYERGTRREGRSFVDGLPRSSLRDLTRRLTFVPAGHEFIEWHEPRILPRVSCFYFDLAALRAESAAIDAARSFVPRLLFKDAALWESALKLKGAIEGARSDNQLYVDALGVVLAHELTRLNSVNPEAPLRGGLAGWQQRSVTAYIEEHLADPIQLSTLAQIARLSPHHFCRAFKRSMGLPPHRYHATRRIERAKAMLEKGPVSITEVGFALGFAQTSSFSAAFRRVTGITASEYQRSVD